MVIWSPRWSLKPVIPATTSWIPFRTSAEAGMRFSGQPGCPVTPPQRTVWSIRTAVEIFRIVPSGKGFAEHVFAGLIRKRSRCGGSSRLLGGSSAESVGGWGRLAAVPGVRTLNVDLLDLFGGLRLYEGWFDAVINLVGSAHCFVGIAIDIYADVKAWPAPTAGSVAALIAFEISSGLYTAAVVEVGVCVRGVTRRRLFAESG